MNRFHLFISVILLSSILFELPQSHAEFRGHVILIHGYGRSASAMRVMAHQFRAHGYIPHTINYSSLTSSIEEAEAEVTHEIDQLLKGRSTEIHFVGHSLGGLLARAYLAKHKPHLLGRVVTLGSPNHGTPAVDHLMQKWWFGLVGSTALALRSGGSKFLSSLPKPNYALGVIAGVSHHPFVKGTKFDGRHDGLVPLKSTEVIGMTDYCVLNSNRT